MRFQRAGGVSRPGGLNNSVRLFVLAVLVSCSLPYGVRWALTHYERGLPENAVHRAREALRRGDVETARAEARAAAGTPDALAPWERGAAARWVAALSVPAYVELTRELLARDLDSEAREVAWRAVRMGRSHNALLEDLAPWMALAACYEKAGDAGRLAGVLGIVSPQSDAARDALLARGARPGALAPGLPAAIRSTPFVPRALQGHEEPIVRRKGDAFEELRSGALTTTLTLEEPVKEIRLSCSSRLTIGLGAIVLVSVNGGEPTPFRATATRASHRVQGALGAGRHEVVVEFLNFARAPGTKEARTLEIDGFVAIFGS